MPAARVLVANWATMAAATRNALTSSIAPSTLIFGIWGAIISTPIPPPKWPTPSTRPKPVVRARVGKHSVDSV
jgi:hypothetical protein